MSAVIVAAKRTPIGAFQGVFADCSAVDLGVAAARGMMIEIDPSGIRDVIVGNVVQSGSGMNVARQIAIKSGLSNAVSPMTVNRVCGSGLQAIISATQAIRAGDGNVYLAGGTESMSQAPYLLQKARAGYRYGNGELVDSLVRDGLTDPLECYAMGVTAENIASRYAISREDQDAFAVESQRRATAAIQAGAFDPEIVPVEVKSKNRSILVTADEHVRPGTTIEALSNLRPAFKSQDGTVTAGNSSGLNDGAAMLLVTSDEYARANGLPVVAEIVSYATVGVNPAVMGMGPAEAMPLACNRAGLTLNDIDLFELNEAFAAQAIAVVRSLNIDPGRVNVRGGAIALGHPIGASGARVVVTLIHALRSTKKELGVASLCIGGGMGIAMVLRARD